MHCLCGWSEWCPICNPKRDTMTEPTPTEPIMKYFAFTHLPLQLQSVSMPFSALAERLLALPRSAERTVALRKLLESKDAAVRAAL